MRRAIATLLGAGLVFVACSNGSDDEPTVESEQTEEAASAETPSAGG